MLFTKLKYLATSSCSRCGGGFKNNDITNSGKWCGFFNAIFFVVVSESLG